VPGTDKPEHPQHTHRHDRRGDFGIKGGGFPFMVHFFCPEMFLVMNILLNLRLGLRILLR